MRKTLLAAFAFLASPALAADTPTGWTAPVAPFAISDEIYYVGTEDLASYLIRTKSGFILIDGTLEQNAPLIEASIRDLGFSLREVKILLNTHAHFDHAAGLAKLKEDTGAKLLASEADGALLAVGGRNDFHFGDKLAYPPVIPDGALKDGQKVALGGVTLTAHLTPGHTKGCTSWTMAAHVKGKPVNMLLSCSVSVPGYALTSEPAYPNIIADYRATFAKLKALPCDMLLAPHGSQFGMLQKRAARKTNPAANPFVDPAFCKRYIADGEAAFEKQLADEQAKAATP